MEYTNTGSVPSGWKELLEKNARIPASFDDDLINHHLAAAIYYVERHRGEAIIDKTCKQIYTSISNSYYLVFKPATITSIKVDGTAITTEDYTLYNSTTPSFFRLDTQTDDQVVEVEYTVTAPDAIRDDIKNFVMMLATAYYNNPEGLPAMDMKRINLHLTSLG